MRNIPSEDHATEVTKALSSFTQLINPEIKKTVSKIKRHLIRLHNSFTLTCIDTNSLTLSFEKNLITICQQIVSRVCVLELNNLRQQNKLVGKNSTDRFQYFVAQLNRPETRTAFYTKYPALRSQTIRQCQYYEKNCIELLDRFMVDYRSIKNVFFNEDEFLLHKIEMVGDKHAQGHNVCILHCKAQSKIKCVVYKPRSLAVDLSFYAFLDWVSVHGFCLKYYAPSILDRKDYGWMQFIEHQTSKNINEIQCYYKRLGGLLATMQLLMGSDIHAENIVAMGAFPVIIDAECLLRPYIKNDLNTLNAITENVSRFFVCDTHFLPDTVRVDDFSDIDISAFSGEGDVKTGRTVIDWENAGTDQMIQKRIPGIFGAFLNQPTLDDKKINPFHFKDAFMEGFQDMYHALIKNIYHLNGKESPLKIFEDVKVRILFRSTRDYYLKLSDSYHPRLMHDANKHSDFFKSLPDFPEQNDIYPSEILDLENSDVPYFYTYANDTHIYSSTGKKLSMAVLLNGYERMSYQLNKYMNEDDLQKQMDIIEASFEAALLSKNIDHTSMNNKFYLIDDNFSYDVIETKAHGIIKEQLNHLAKRMIKNCGRVYWPCIVREKQELYRRDFTNIMLYDGVAGIGLAFSWAAEKYKNGLYHAIATECANSIHKTLTVKKDDFFSSVGGYVGLGSLVYALYYFYKTLQNAEFLSDIRQCCVYIKKLIPKDTCFDIIGGVSGCLLALIRAKELIDSTFFNSLAHHCVEHILQYYPKPNTLPTPMKMGLLDKPLLGFSHGTSGILFALDQYDTLFPGNPDVKTWIERALDYEEAFFSLEEHNWPDFRKTGKRKFMQAWCHGAPGIVISRRRMSSRGHPPCYFENKMDAIYDSIIKNGFHGNSQLCHGDVGVLESIPADHPLYFSLLKSIILNIERHGLNTGEIPVKFTPGLMTGVAGVAVGLMRLMDSSTIPSVLLLA